MYKVGDTVRIKSKEWFQNNITEQRLGGNLLLGKIIVPDIMLELCNTCAVITHTRQWNSGPMLLFKLEQDIWHWDWCEEMFDPLYVRRKKLEKIYANNSKNITIHPDSQSGC